MPINPRPKGQSGEREICTMLNEQFYIVNHMNSLSQPPVEPFQRNQNQSAVGGDDITMPDFFALSIEVKRQEQLSVNTWWKQCLASAGEEKIPILAFRQNRKPWRFIMWGALQGAPTPIRVEIRKEDFLEWFESYYENILRQRGLI